MLIKSNLFIIFSAFSLTSSFFVIWTKNPIFSVLFLIFSFFNVSTLLFLLNFEFLPITFLIVYVGAVAVLFLFVLMMLNIKLAELLENYYSVVPIGILFAFLFFYQLVFLFRFEFELFNNFDKFSLYFLTDVLNTTNIKLNFTEISLMFSNIKTIAFSLFTTFLCHFLVAGVILLLAMLASIVLTLQKLFVSKNQNIYKQILKDHNNSIKLSV
jgi:NADH-quinone oxidoreductase subunit J